MRRLLPLALLLAACAKPAETPKLEQPPLPAAGGPAQVDLTPESVAKAADVPLYPGAEAPENMSTVPEHRSDGSTHYSLVLATSDPAKKVAEFYAERLKSRAVSTSHGLSIFTKSPKGNDVSVLVGTEAGRTLVRIKSIAYGP